MILSRQQKTIYVYEAVMDAKRVRDGLDAGIYRVHRRSIYTQAGGDVEIVWMDDTSGGVHTEHERY